MSLGKRKTYNNKGWLDLKEDDSAEEDSPENEGDELFELLEGLTDSLNAHSKALKDFSEELKQKLLTLDQLACLLSLKDQPTQDGE